MSDKDGTLSGIFYGGDGVPYFNVDVSIDEIKLARTDINGKYKITGIEPGTHYISFNAENSIPVIQVMMNHKSRRFPHEGIYHVYFDEAEKMENSAEH